MANTSVEISETAHPAAKGVREPLPRFSLFQLTLPYAREVLFKSRGSLVALVLLGLVAGVFPAIKSQVESALIRQVDAVLSGRIDQSTLQNGGVLALPLSPPAPLRDVDSADLPARFTTLLVQYTTIGMAPVLFMILALVTATLAYLSTVLQTRITQGFYQTLRRSAMEKALNADPSRVPSVTNAAGQYATAIQQGATSIGASYGYLIDVSQYLLALATTLLLIGSKSIPFAVSCLVLAAGQVGVSIFRARRLEHARKTLDTQRNDLVARTDDILSRRELILAYDQQERYASKLQEFTGKYADIQRRIDIQESLYSGLADLVTDTGKIGILITTLVIAGTVGATSINNIGDAYFLISIYVRIFVPISNLLNRYDRIKESEAVSRTFLQVLQSHGDAPEPAPQPVHPIADDVAIAFHEVRFKYDSTTSPPTEHWILNGCTFTVPRGGMTLLVGPSGSGKTTIARLLLGFWPITCGEATVLGKSLADWQGENLRNRLDYVPQNEHLVDETVRENLTWGEKCDDVELLQVLQQVGLDKSGILDKQAKTLSGGEQQRLSVARMLLGKSEIAILDEPLAGVDVFTLRDVMPHVVKKLESPDQTFLMISHRVSFARHAAHVIVLNDEGAVTEEGSPEELLGRNGAFARAYQASQEELGVWKAV